MLVEHMHTVVPTMWSPVSQVQVERLESELKESIARRGAAEESAELMRERAEKADAKLSELRSELRGAAAACLLYTSPSPRD